MPIYEYQCTGCDAVFEEWQSGFEERQMVCPECGRPASRLISHTSFHLKGSGWYVTDYAAKKSEGATSCTESGCKAGTDKPDCAASGCDAGCSDAVPAGKKAAADTPSAGSAS
ncbi:zinc ribbon domain-containing protein [Pseudodesulfovibrio sp. F-1]|uniref:Zinc ribbon domain-containing protein n=1 Tax=Pseudodesulfovibrio alkaliphilus TaxID=2661613 RepID=A0A7K1KPB2_9BACT|nr:zinc ribbon domain-containing protein [Pseudodesulfovibrio alkaliphilus]MUM77934.1 zinc ribbon domain-containing protein [Pseudodesulfovibrio alkaliphilus]